MGGVYVSGRGYASVGSAILAEQIEEQSGQHFLLHSWDGTLLMTL